MATLDEALTGLDEVTAVEVLVRAWRASGAVWLAEEITTRCWSYSQSHDWDLDRFDVLTLSPVLDWLISAGPTSGSLGVVLDRITPYLPDPRATKALTALVEKKTTEDNKVRELLAFNAVKPSTLTNDEAIVLVLDRKRSLGERAKRIDELVGEADAGKRMVLADWLADQGEPLGEFVGLQLQRASGTPPSPREIALWGQHGLSWIERFLGTGATASRWYGNGESKRERVVFEHGVPVSVVLESMPSGLAGGWKHVRALTWPQPRWSYGDDSVESEGEDDPRLLGLLLRLEKLEAPLHIARRCLSPLKELVVRPPGRQSWSAALQPLAQFTKLESYEVQGLSATQAGAKTLLTEFKKLAARALTLRLIIDDATLTIRLPSGQASLELPRDGTRMKQRQTQWQRILEVVTGQTGKLKLAGGGKIAAELARFVK